MKRTYVDITGEYYDHQDNIHSLLTEANIKRIFRSKINPKRQKIGDD